MGATAAFWSAVFPAVMLPTFQGVSLQMTGLFYKSNKYGQAAAVLCVFFKFRRGENVKGRLNCYQATSFVLDVLFVI